MLVYANISLSTHKFIRGCRDSQLQYLDKEEIDNLIFICNWHEVRMTTRKSKQ